jgi:cytochrome c556
MKYMIDPLSDNIFDAVWWDTTKTGIVKHEPKTQDDWDRVRTGAVALAEGVELLKVPRPWTPDGDVNHSTGPNPPELSPTQIQAKLDADPVLWEAKIQALRNAALEIIDVAKDKNVNAIFEASEDVDQACESCHLEYWYPGDAAAVREWKNGKVRFGKPTSPPPHN